MALLIVVTSNRRSQGNMRDTYKKYAKNLFLGIVNCSRLWAVFSDSSYCPEILPLLSDYSDKGKVAEVLIVTVIWIWLTMLTYCEVVNIDNWRRQ